MKKRFQTILAKASIVSVAVLTISGAGYVFAQPTTAPGPGVSGVPLPIHTGSEAQVKSGALTVSGGLTTTTLTADQICLAGDCQTSWPSGGALAAASISGGGFISGYCYNYTTYDNLTYWQYGSGPYTYNTYNCGPSYENFSVTIPFGGQVPSGSSIVSSSNETVWCHGGQYDYSYTGNPQSYINDSYYPYRTAATNVDITASGDNFVVTGTCRFLNGSSYVYRGIRIESADILYSS